MCIVPVLSPCCCCSRQTDRFEIVSESSFCICHFIFFKQIYFVTSAQCTFIIMYYEPCNFNKTTDLHTFSMFFGSFPKADLKLLSDLHCWSNKSCKKHENISLYYSDGFHFRFVEILIRLKPCKKLECLMQ